MNRFDKLALDWDNDPAHTERTVALANEILSFFDGRDVSDAFEFGCATGSLSLMLKDRFQKILMADNSEGMIDVLNSKLVLHKINHLKGICINLQQQPLQLSFDVIYTAMTLHHILDLTNIVTTFHQMLKQDGYLVIADLVEEDGSFHWHVPGFDGYNGFERFELEKNLARCGYNVLYYNEYYTIRKKDSLGAIREYPLFVMIAQKKS
jgi:2-polyprenyl-3-methyl-5-hydroxy-6-metoxy-1,4-benzoquinol methylase